MKKVISKTIKVNSTQMPPSVNFIENEIIKSGLKPLRWAIVNIQGSELTLSVSGIEN